MVLTNRRRFLFLSFSILVFLTALNLVGITFSLYWRIWWFDIPAHALGGISVALGAAWLSTVRGRAPTFLFCIGATILVGVAWEIFEATFHLTEFPQDTLDTIKDLCMDTTGGVLAFLFVRMFR